MTGNFEIVEPDPSALIESLRSFGYSVQASIADLIDNSITAYSENVWVDFEWGGPDSVVTITDDGVGMDDDRLSSAMRPGSMNPLAERGKHDLGRFGLGLKTASFSQARRLTVGSRTAQGQISVRCWDLDHVGRTGQWQLLKTAGSRAEEEIQRLGDLDSGTVVVLESLDRVVDDRPTDDDGASRHFYDNVDAVERHLAMVFHRFIARGQGGVTLNVNGHRVEPWDPFMIGSSATQRLPRENLRLPSGTVTVEPFVLPHHSRLTADEHRSGAGTRGWNAHQGFYVYRADRLLVDGDWLVSGLKAEEHHKLARIAVDITQGMDHDWDIDVRKSRARPPAALRDDLLRIARATRKKAAEVYRHRGKRISKIATVQKPVQAWDVLRKDGEITYRVNRDHGIVRAALTGDREHCRRVRALIELIERTVPVPRIAVDAFECPDEQADADGGELSSDLARAAGELYQNYLDAGESPENARVRVLMLEPFGNHSEVVAALGEQCDDR